MAFNTLLEELVEELRAAGLLLTVDADRDHLLLSSQNDPMALNTAMNTTDLGVRIRQNKAALIEYLQEASQTARTTVQAQAEQIARDHDRKATLPGGTPPLERVQERMAWLAGIDWARGLRCGKTGEQCKVCQGTPCWGSAEWERE